MLNKIIDADGVQRSGVLIGNTLYVVKVNGKMIDADMPVFKVPTDIKRVVHFLRDFGDELPDLMGCNCKEHIQNLTENIKHWKTGGCEPNWDGFRSEINMECDDEGMPRLFE